MGRQHPLSNIRASVHALPSLCAIYVPYIFKVKSCASWTQMVNSVLFMLQTSFCFVSPRGLMGGSMFCQSPCFKLLSCCNPALSSSPQAKNTIMIDAKDREHEEIIKFSVFLYRNLCKDKNQ
jgi:hypothetical protein